MRKNITHTIHILGAALVAVILFGANSCYAEKISEEVTVQCGSRVEKPGVREWLGVSGTQYILKTEGIRVLGEPELVTDWLYYILAHQGTIKISSNNTGVDVRAVCKSPDSLVARLKVDMWPGDDENGLEKVMMQSTTIPCNEGESLRVIMIDPEDPNPNMYNYVGMLTKITR